MADGSAESLAAAIGSEKTLGFLKTFYKGPLRYRLEFTGRGHQRGLIRDVTDRVFALNPTLINDSRSADWQIDIQPSSHRQGLELTPRLKPDPRFAYRLRDVPAASHPPLAACMARLAGPFQKEIIWDPFCGSGLELIECGLCGGVDRLMGSDISPEAVDIASANLASALGTSIPADFFCSDFRSLSTSLPPVSLIISNPPMGRRVPIRNLELLIADLFETARSVLKPGGRLVFANPLPVKPDGQELKLVYRKKMDLGGFHVHLEKYSKD
jgi:23S rRNA G2445 N2-methylase RlmL